MKFGHARFLHAIFIKHIRVPFWFKFSLKGTALSSFEPGGPKIRALLGLLPRILVGGLLMAASGSESFLRTDALAPSAELASSVSAAPADYEEAVAEVSPAEEVQVDECSADTLAEAYGRIFQWEHNAFAVSPQPALLHSATSVLGRQSLDERVITLLDELAHLMHRVKLLEQEICDHRSFAIELHSNLMDISQQVHRHDVSRREVAEAVTALQQRFRALLSSNRSRSPRTPP